MIEPKIVTTYRIKNEERWIEKSLESASKLCPAVVVLDDGSTDNTVKICKSFDKVVDIHQQSNLPFSELRDRNKLLEMVMRQEADFLLGLDGDEIVQRNTKQILF